MPIPFDLSAYGGPADGVVIDNVLMNAKAHKEGASWLTLAAGMVAGIAGTIFLPPIGGLIAAPLVILLLEYWRQHDFHKALLTLRGLAIGWGSAFVVRFFIAVAIIGLWLIWALPVIGAALVLAVLQDALDCYQRAVDSAGADTEHARRAFARFAGPAFAFVTRPLKNASTRSWVVGARGAASGTNRFTPKGRSVSRRIWRIALYIGQFRRG